MIYHIRIIAHILLLVNIFLLFYDKFFNEIAKKFPISRKNFSHYCEGGNAITIHTFFKKTNFFQKMVKNKLTKL